jgi:predicted transcriptional regulator of viral defense system
MTEQIPNKAYITTSGNISAERKINSQSNNLKGFTRKIYNIIYVFIKVKPERFFGVKKYWVGEKKVTITDPERTLIDGLMSPRYFGGWAEVYNAFELHVSRVNINKLITYAMRLDASVVKRLGWILEKNGVEEKKLQKLLAFPIKGYRILDPSGSQTGPYNKKWMIRENISVKGMK